MLNDTHILDLTDEPLALGARMLSDIGADVVRVEDARGDHLRMREPTIPVSQASAPRAERGWAHLLYNAGKRSVAVNFDEPATWTRIESLLPQFDVVLAPLEPTGALADWLDRGRHGEWTTEIPIVEAVFRRGAVEPMTDLTAMAAGGHIVLNGHPEDPPVWPAGNLSHKQGSIAMAEAAMALIMQRRRGGEVGRITVGMQEAVTFTTLQTASGNFWTWHGISPSRHIPIGSGVTFKSRDDHWLSFTIHPPHWYRFVNWVDDVLGLTEGELRGEDWDDEFWREQHQPEIIPWIDRLCQALAVSELHDKGQELGLLVLPINTVEEVARDPHLIARGYYQSVDHPQLGISLILPRSPIRTRGEQPRAKRAPALGEHNTEIFETSPSGEGAAERRRGPAANDNSSLFASVPPPQRPLDGVRVLDFTWAIAGSLGTRLLSDLGAEVLKIESESRIDPIRYRGVQPPDHFSINTNGTFNDCAGGKKSVTLNLKTEEGIEAVRELARQADLVTSNYTPYRLDRWGIGYDDLRQIKQDIIVCNVAVMGIEGPRAEWRSYGNGIVAMCGLAHRSGFPGKAPIGLGTLHTDFTVPYYLATSVMAALDHRERTGEGGYLEIAQYETAVQLLDTELIEALNGGHERPRMGNRSPFMAPHGVFPSAGEERWVAIACRDDNDWRNLCRVMGRADLAARPELDTLAGRQAYEDEIEAAITEWTLTQDDWTAYRLMINADVPASPVERLEDFFDGPDRAMRGNYSPAESPEGPTFQIQQEPVLWDGQRLPAVRAPIWSEHTEDVLKTLLNYNEADMIRLAAAGTLG
jgi:crotonobetainyl-CoA:carnitine CoA-transferase CaiB-like acyl-CoA transferase